MGRSLRIQAGATLLVLSVLLGTPPSRSDAACVGDCDGNGEVIVNELVIMVNIALGSASLSSCPAGDADGSGDITINELIVAVNNALDMCPLPPATSTPTEPLITPTPTPTELLITPTPTIAPTLGPLGIRHFVLNPANSPFAVVGVQGTTPFVLGGFQGQKNGLTGLPGYLDLQAGQPDGHGFATLDVVDASDYLYVDATATAQVVVCIKPMVPLSNAGLVACNGGLDFSLEVTQNHHLGQVGINGFTVDQCTGQGGSVESPNQICGAGMIGRPCRVNGDCDSSSGAGDGVCGVSPSTCSAPNPAHGASCQADGDCDTGLGSNDGICGFVAPHPGVCNGIFEVGQLGGDSGPGAVSIARVPELGLNGLPLELKFEQALPCGDEGPGDPAPFAFTSAAFRSRILNFNNMTGMCSAGTTSNSCTTNADCDSASGAGDGICGATLEYNSQGQDFSCADWQANNAPGCLVFSVPQLDVSPQTAATDIITAFEFCGQ
jgi:hypothetical protein